MNAPLVLLYNLDNRNGSRLRLICLKLHIRVLGRHTHHARQKLICRGRIYAHDQRALHLGIAISKRFFCKCIYLITA